MSEPGKAPGGPGGPGGPDDMVLGNKEPVSPEVQPEAPVEVRPPAEQYLEEGGFGWVVVAAVCFVNAHTWGLNSSFGVFLAFYIKNNTFQSSALGYAFIGGLSVSVAFLVSPLATFLGGWDKYGTRLTVFTGGIFVVIAFIGSSFATKLWHIILTQGVAFGIGLGLSFVASAPVPAQWFHKKRSLANGLSTAGSGFGGLIYSLGANAMIEHIGLAWTFRALAVICFVVNGVAAFFIRDRNKAVGSVHIAFNWKLFRRPEPVCFQGFACRRAVQL
ncbi:major facilitator superfamily domain-containing protein [Xylaria sp. CBS 124048]|nr:major facilitator superfamily domain-containing protein [Xylaria sp. CBS 124048]